MNVLGLANQPRTETDPRTSALARLGEEFRGELVLPGHARYEQARRVWNGMVDKRPMVVLYCAGHEDVIKAIHFARSQSVPVAVRSGGHNVAGLSVCDGGVVIDLSRMKRIEVDHEGQTTRAEAGLSLGEFDTATQAYGLATTMGVNSDTGIAGGRRRDCPLAEIRDALRQQGCALRLLPSRDLGRSG